MTHSLIKIAAAFAMTLGFATAFAGPLPAIPSTQDPMDFGIIVGAFAPKMKTVKAGAFTYHIIAPDLIEPACNSTQIVLWVEDETTEGDAGGVGYNLGVQAASLKSVKAVKDEVEIKYTVNNVDDCSTSVEKTVYVTYPGAAGALSVRE